VRRHPEWRSIPIVVVTARDLSTEERQRLSGYVETILQKAGDSHDALLRQVCERLCDWAPRALTPHQGDEARAPAA